MSDQAPVTAAIRHDGWTPERRTQFLDHLAHDGSVRAACGRVGMSREAAYRLKRRDALFARGWDAALVLARAASAEVLACRALDGVEEEIWYRGERVGTRRKYDARLLLAHIARLDKIADGRGAEYDAGRFDEILAVVGGEAVPDGIECTDDGMPLDRESHAAIAAEDAKIAFDDAWPAERPDCEECDADDQVEVHRAYHEALLEDRWNARTAAGAVWDACREQAHAAADRLLALSPADERGGNAVPGTLSELSTSPADGEAADGQDSVAVVAPVSPSPPRGPHPFGYTYARA